MVTHARPKCQLHGVSDAVPGSNWRHPRGCAPSCAGYAKSVLRLPSARQLHMPFSLSAGLPFLLLLAEHRAGPRDPYPVSSLRRWIAEASSANPGRVSPRAAHTRAERRPWFSFATVLYPSRHAGCICRVARAAGGNLGRNNLHTSSCRCLQDGVRRVLVGILCPGTWCLCRSRAIWAHTARSLEAEYPSIPPVSRQPTVQVLVQQAHRIRRAFAPCSIVGACK